MGLNSLIQVRVDEELKRTADELFTDLGLDTPTAIRIFLKQSVNHHGLPFALVQPTPNAETIAAMNDIKAGINLIGPFNSVQDFMASLQDDSEVDDV